MVRLDAAARSQALRRTDPFLTAPGCSHGQHRLSFRHFFMNAAAPIRISADDQTGDFPLEATRVHTHKSASDFHADPVNRRRLLTGSLWVHCVSAGAILAAGFVVGEVSSAADVSAASTRTAGILTGCSSTLVAGFGLAIYTCVISRKRQRRSHAQEQLGPYTLHELIGSGGMGDVFLAEHRLLKRKCAVKLIRRDKSADKKMLVRFEREVKATAQLTHWNTVQIYDYGSTPNGTFYYAMEYLQGLNLRQLVDEFGPLPAGRVIYILRQLCGALHEAAQQGLVHRDIKPSNIFLAERGQVYDVAKLLDFGLVRPASFSDGAIQAFSCKLQGSPRFMCPEQARGAKPDCRGDLYSLAVVAYYLLTGRTPFEDDNPVMLVMAHATVEAPRVDAMGVSVPLDLAEVVMKCLRKQPTDRYQSARELQEALEQCASSREWTWLEAEAWWHQHPNQILQAANDPAPHAVAATRSPESSVGTEPDATLVCEDSKLFHQAF